jgi:hypothetical protein
VRILTADYSDWHRNQNPDRTLISIENSENTLSLSLIPQAAKYNTPIERKKFLFGIVSLMVRPL